MKHISKLFLLALLLYAFSASSQTADLSPIQENIQKYCDQLDDLRTVKLGKQKVIGNREITGFYKSLDYNPLWSSAKNRNDLLDILEGSYFEGLNPEDYHTEFIMSYMEDLKKGIRKTVKESAIADVVMTDAMLTYALHMIQGKLNPVSMDPNWNYSENKLPDEVEINVLHRLQAESLLEGADKIRSQLPMYQKLKRAFARIDSLQKEGVSINMIEYPGTALRLGDSATVVSEIKMNLGNYFNVFDESNANVFDETLESAVKQFQSQNGLDDDGIAGKETFEMLNISLEDRLDIIRVNMERCRWVNNQLPEEFILVNIAAYNLYLIRQGQVDYTCRVVVGKEFHETPVFTSAIKYLVFNPTWTVPYSISSKEILPKLKRDPNYLKDRNMTLLKGGQEIDPSTVDFKRFSQNNFPYTIRQEPGPSNALGMVKFIFPNKHAVYLHDTPSKSYFEKTNRAYSHGCVRVHKPMVLAEILLDDKGYNQDKIATVLKSKELTNVYLSKPMPVMLMYWTFYENEGKMYFYRDTYGRDKRIIKELKDSR